MKTKRKLTLVSLLVSGRGTYTGFHWLPVDVDGKVTISYHDAIALVTYEKGYR